MSLQTIITPTIMLRPIVGSISVSLLFLNGCKKESDMPANSNETVFTTHDVADIVSDALASDNNGVIDQTNDLFEIMVDDTNDTADLTTGDH